MWTSVLFFNNKEESSNGSKCWLQETIILQNNMKNKPWLSFEVHYIVWGNRKVLIRYKYLRLIALWFSFCLHLSPSVTLIYNWIAIFSLWVWILRSIHRHSTEIHLRLRYNKKNARSLRRLLNIDKYRLQ